MKRLARAALSLLCAVTAQAQTHTFQSPDWTCRIDEGGTLQQIIFRHDQGNDTIPFFTNKKNAGPRFYLDLGNGTEVATWTRDGDNRYRATLHDVECLLSYKTWHGQPALEVTMTNRGHVPFQPVKAGLKLGIDTYMDKYPDWFGKYFPTLMMNEPTHFYGYMQTPGGGMLALVSPDAVASWSVDYNLGYQDPPPHWFMGHRIESINLDLINALPLPAHCPQDAWQLDKGERRTWTLAFADITTADDFEATLHRIGGIPMLRMAQTTYRPGETASFEVLAQHPAVTVTSPDGKPVAVTLRKTEDGVFAVSVPLSAKGLYGITVTDADKTAHGILSAHATWQWTLEQARKGAEKYKQKATSHIESWYGFHSAFLAARYFPSASDDKPLRQRFDYLFNLLHDTVAMKPLYHASRIQNTSGTIGLLVDKFEAYGDTADLRKAARLADWLMQTWQRKDGAYVNHNTVYTSVIYVAKSMLELTLCERALAKKDPAWQTLADRHYLSAKRAIDQLVASQGDFETEGEMTFEDGMISCSALQIGMFALMQTDEAARAHYTRALMEILSSHDCLAQLRVPDARRRGGTMRYWEAQYDVQMLPNMFNSPHGWSAWRAYATYYAYLLTGEERWLRETYNAAGAFANLIDVKSGDLRWAFVVDPSLRVRQACGADTTKTADDLSFGNPHPDLYPTQTFTIGEQYVNMVSDWQGVNTQDNDVHEVFKCIGEAFLTNAFIVERPDGTLAAYNCTLKQRGNRLTVTADEPQITHLHCNLRHACRVTFRGEEKTLPENTCAWAFGGDAYRE